MIIITILLNRIISIVFLISWIIESYFVYFSIYLRMIIAPNFFEQSTRFVVFAAIDIRRFMLMGLIYCFVLYMVI